MEFKMSVKFNGSVSTRRGSIKISTQHKPKVTSTEVFIKFSTSESNLLDELLKMYRAEKLITIGANNNNRIDYMKCNNNCIYAVMPEATVLTFIANTYKYLMNASIKSVSIRNCIMKTQSYKKLHDDIAKGFEVIVTGKCKLLTTKFVDRSPHVEKLSKTINSIEIKKIDDIVVKKAPEPYFKEFSISGGNLAKLYFAIFCKDFNFSFKGNKIITDDHTLEEMKFFIKEHTSLAQGLIKAWLTQAGRKKTKPAGNDSGGAKMRQSNGIALDCINTMSKIVCELFGISVINFTQATWELDKDALAEMKKMLDSVKIE